MILIFLNFLRLVFCPIMLSVSENVPCAFEKNVYFASFGWKVLYISIMAIWYRMLFSAIISLLIIYLEDLSIVVNEVLKSPMISVLLIYLLKSSMTSLIYLSDPILDAYMFIFKYSYIGCIYAYKGFIFFMDSFLQYYVVTFFISFYVFCFEIYFVWYVLLSQHFFSHVCLFGYIFHLFTFCLSTFCSELDPWKTVYMLFMVSYLFSYPKFIDCSI